MTSRYVPNEVACPVRVEVLAALLHADKDAVAGTVDALPLAQRAALAGFCFSRSHLRNLSFLIAARCDVSSLRAMTGLAGEALIEHSRNPGTFDEGPRVFGRKAIALARSAA